MLINLYIRYTKSSYLYCWSRFPFDDHASLEALPSSWEDFSASFSVFPDIPDDFVPGRISRPEHYPFWRDVLKADPEILSIIREGYRVPFRDNVWPPPSFEPNNRSALERSDFLLQELLRWEKIGCTRS